ncbi:diguanylate cyclase [Reinekea marina]|uniref:diguanylate cyclase n=1 Tax=Reinekea marina TaxID=1310421 RepID=A0ABV7WMF4_9GAMM|nr:diguanylate cyclase [Reinekea marina]MDN3648354.1 diguanylate cyclase [Reinekea marina]
MVIFCLFLSGLSSANWVEESRLRAEIDTQALRKGEAIELNGEWWFKFGEHIKPEDVPLKLKQQALDTINVPSSWNEKVKPLTDEPNQHGKATYVLPISFSSPVDFSVIVEAGLITSTYRIYWLEEGTTEAFSVGAAGEMINGQKVEKGIDFFNLPAQQQGALIIHVSKTNMFKGGVRHPVRLQRSDVFLKANVLNVFVTSLLIGSMLVLCIHYLIQYRYSTNNISALYLSILCFIAALRSMVTSGYFDLLIQGFIDQYLIVSIKTEYITVFLIPISYFIFISSLFRSLSATRFIRHAVLFGLYGVLVTVLLPTEVMTRSLVFYQLILGLWAVINLSVVALAIRRRLKFSKQILLSVLVVLAGAVNDIVASHSATYNSFVSSYVFFIFLFMQALIVGQQLRESMSQANRLNDEKLKLQKEHVKALMASQLDHLTGLNNRLACTEKIKQLDQESISKFQFVGVIMLDIDHFKKINDNYGHDVGDEILIFVASLLHGFQLRSEDFKCRYGGEEFLVLLPGATIERTEVVAESMRQALEKYAAFQNNGFSIHITASFGVSVQDKHAGKGLKEVISEADQALYRAKESGRNRVSL